MTYCPTQGQTDPTGYNGSRYTSYSIMQGFDGGDPEVSL